MTLEPGVNITLDPDLADADCALAAQLGARWVRTSQEQGWGRVDDRLGPFRRACDAHGLLLFNTCQPTGHVVPKTVGGVAAWGDFVAECATYCDMTGTGNEPNNFGSNETPDPVGYAHMTMAVITSRDLHASGRRLVTPELAPGSGVAEPVAWFCKMVDAVPDILRATKVAVGWHGYCDGRYPATTPTAPPNPWNTCYEQRALQVELARRGQGAKPIVNGELGAATGPTSFNAAVPVDVQAQRLRDYLVELHAQQRAGVHHGPWFWYQLRNRPVPTDPTKDVWTNHAGLVDVNGSLLPVGAAFKALAAPPAHVTKP